MAGHVDGLPKILDVETSRRLAEKDEDDRRLRVLIEHDFAGLAADDKTHAGAAVRLLKRQREALRGALELLKEDHPFSSIVADIEDLLALE